MLFREIDLSLEFADMQLTLSNFSVFSSFCLFIFLSFQCRMWGGLDGMGILGHRYSKSTFGANENRPNIIYNSHTDIVF